MSRVDLKVVLLGNAAVGKTSLMERYVSERFNDSLPYQNTIGAAFAAKQIQVNEKTFIMGIWDTAGSEKYDAMTRIYYRGAKAAIVCYDVTKPITFQKVKFWIRELRENEENCKIYICGTKKDILDLSTTADSDLQNVEKYASGIQAKLFITSSKTGENVFELFNEIGHDLIHLVEEVNPEKSSFSLNKNHKKTSCCWSST
ncbi:ras-related protein Rab-24-like [Prorops nasuta]|uniref:ras-related protein Rab-24-like n=1 Tax=Prorops nasuta TaxID=863751 RepID=UPI0034CEDF9E